MDIDMRAAAAVLAAAFALTAAARTPGFRDDMDAVEREVMSDDGRDRVFTPGESVRVESDRWSPLGLPVIDFPAREGGCNIYGLDIGVCYPRKSTVAGVQLGLFGAVSSRCYGVKCGLWAASVQEPSAGVMLSGLLSIADGSFRGVMAAPLGNASDRFSGVQLGAGNVASPDSFALQAGILNSASDAHGFLVQLGLYNIVSGGDACFVQVGLLNSVERVSNATNPFGKATALPLLRVHWN